jgi:hypothetical protein
MGNYQEVQDMRGALACPKDQVINEWNSHIHLCTLFAPAWFFSDDSDFCDRRMTDWVADNRCITAGLERAVKSEDKR